MVRMTGNLQKGYASIRSLSVTDNPGLFDEMVGVLAPDIMPWLVLGPVRQDWGRGLKRSDF